MLGRGASLVPIYKLPLLWQSTGARISHVPCVIYATSMTDAEARAQVVLACFSFPPRGTHRPHFSLAWRCQGQRPGAPVLRLVTWALRSRGPGAHHSRP